MYGNRSTLAACEDPIQGIPFTLRNHAGFPIRRLRLNSKLGRPGCHASHSQAKQAQRSEEPERIGAVHTDQVDAAHGGYLPRLFLLAGAAIRESKDRLKPGQLLPAVPRSEPPGEHEIDIRFSSR